MHATGPFFALLAIVLGYGSHLVILLWARRLLKSAGNVRAAAVRTRTIALAALLISFVPFLLRRVTLFVHVALVDACLSFVMLELTFAVVLALPLAAMMLGLRVTQPRAVVEDVNEADPTPPEAPTQESLPVVPASLAPPAFGRRRAIETIGSVVATGTAGLVVGWGTTRGRHDYEISEVPVRIERLPRALDGYVIAQISDIHAGLFVGERELREAQALVRSIKPDILVATGDLVDFDARHAPALARALADMPTRDGTYAILGNHDYYAGVTEVIEAVRGAGVHLMVNEGRVLRPGDGGGFALLGVDDQWSPRFGGAGPRLSLASQYVPDDMPRVLLSHQPDTFEHYMGRVALQLSGHTHGGQIRPAGMLLRWTAGAYARGSSTLYVNRGFGVAGPPARLGVRPEITKLILVAA